MALPSLRPFNLVGGTALALRFGHRSSVDLDIFFHEKFDHIKIENELQLEFSNDFSYESGHKKFGIFCYIQKIKINIVYFPHPPIAKFVTEDNIRMYTNSDIAAMKIQAILGRAQKKNFWGLHELLQHYSLQQIMDWHKQKYPNQMLAISIPNAISNFTEADDSETPACFKGQTWEKVQDDIKKVVRDYLS